MVFLRAGASADWDRFVPPERYEIMKRILKALEEDRVGNVADRRLLASFHARLQIRALTPRELELFEAVCSRWSV